MFQRTISPGIELRQLGVSDAEDLFHVVDRNREHLRKWMRWVDNTRCVDDCKATIERTLERFAVDGSFDAGVYAQGRLVGMISLHQINWRDMWASVGYWLAEEHQGRGLMIKACAAMLDYVFRDLEMNRIQIDVVVTNTRSRAVPRRLGFRYEGTLRKSYNLNDELLDLEVYGILRKEWLSRNNQ